MRSSELQESRREDIRVGGAGEAFSTDVWKYVNG